MYYEYSREIPINHHRCFRPIINILCCRTSVVVAESIVLLLIRYGANAKRTSRDWDTYRKNRLQQCEDVGDALDKSGSRWMGTTLPLFGERKPPPVGRRYWIYWSWLIVLLHDDILVRWCCVRFLDLYLYHGICYADSEKYPVASRSVLKALHRMDEMDGLIHIALQAA